MRRRHTFFKRANDTLNWNIESDEPLLWHAKGLAAAWISRELKYKGKVKGGLLNKACGILAEEIFDAMLGEFKKFHDRTILFLTNFIPLTKASPTISSFAMAPQ